MTLAASVWASGCRVRINQSRNQREIRRRFVIAAAPSLSSLWRARLRRIMRMQGRLGRLGYLPSRPQTPSDIAVEDLEEIVEGGRSQRILGREVFAFDAELRIKDRKVKNCLVSAYQSQLSALFLNGIVWCFHFPVLAEHKQWEADTRTYTEFHSFRQSTAKVCTKQRRERLFFFFFPDRHQNKSGIIVYQLTAFSSPYISSTKILFESCHIAATLQDSWAQLCLADVKASWQSN